MTRMFLAAFQWDILRLNQEKQQRGEKDGFRQIAGSFDAVLLFLRKKYVFNRKICGICG